MLSAPRTGGAEETKRERYIHWVVPDAKNVWFVPDAAQVTRLVESLVRAGWMRIGPGSPYDANGPFLYSSYLGTANSADVRPGDPRFDLAATGDGVIRPSHCESLTLMVTDALLVAPTTNAHAANPLCRVCGARLLPEPEPERSRLVPTACAGCGLVIDATDLLDLPIFRFALVIETWFPPKPETSVSLDPKLRVLLESETGHVFKTDGQVLPVP